MDTVSPFLHRAKALSSLDSTSGGALVRPPAQGVRVSPFRNRAAVKAMPEPSEDDVKAQLIAEILARVFGEDDTDAKSLQWHVKRAEGETWQGAKNRWFGIRNGRVVPVKNPNAEPKKPKEPNPVQAPRAPAKIHRMTLDQARETMAELKAQGPTEERLEVLVASLATLTVKDLEVLKKEVGAKGGKVKADLIAKIRGTLGEVKKAEAEGDVEEATDTTVESSSQSTAGNTATSPTKAPTETETWDTLASAWKDVYRRNIRKGGIVTIPEVVDVMTEANPQLTAEGIHELLWKWKKDNDIVLQVCNDPRLEPRAGEGIRKDKGVYLYVKMDPDAPAPEPEARSKPTIPERPRQMDLPTDDALKSSTFEPFAPKNSQHGKVGNLGKVRVDGSTYFYKVVPENIIAREKASADIAALCGVGCPAAKVADVPGKGKGLLTTWTDGVTLLQAKRRKTPPKVASSVVDRHMAFTFLIALSDRHPGNYMIDKGGNVISIDHEYSLMHSDDRTAAGDGTMFVRQAALRKFRDPPDGAISRDVLRDVAAQAEPAAAMLRQSGMDGEADGVLARGRVLAELADGPEENINRIFR